MTIADLVAFFRNPARALLRRLDVATSYDADDVRDAIPIELDGLDKWAVGDRMVQAILQGADPQDVCTAELHRGALPPGELGPAALRTVVEDAHKVLNDSARLRVGEPQTREVVVDIGDGRRVIGAVGGVHGDAIVRLTYSSLRAKQALEASIHLLVLQAATPDRPLVAHAFGKGRNGHGTVGPVDADFARRHLRELLDVREEGLRRLVTLPMVTGRTWARGREQSVAKARYLAGLEWQGSDRSPVPGEREDAAWVRLLGDGAALDALTDLPDLATRVWSPLLQHEGGWAH